MTVVMELQETLSVISLSRMFISQQLRGKKVSVQNLPIGPDLNALDRVVELERELEETKNVLNERLIDRQQTLLSESVRRNKAERELERCLLIGARNEFFVKSLMAWLQELKGRAEWAEKCAHGEEAKNRGLQCQQDYNDIMDLWEVSAEQT